jgi:hypothetical protein
MTMVTAHGLADVLAPYGGGERFRVAVWGTEIPGAGAPPTMEESLYGVRHPRFVVLAGNEEGLVLVRQTHEDDAEDLDGRIVPWAKVRSLSRESHLTKDVLEVGIEGGGEMKVAVSSHLRLHGNRGAARSLCDLWTRNAGDHAPGVLPKAS